MRHLLRRWGVLQLVDADGFDAITDEMLQAHNKEARENLQQLKTLTGMLKKTSERGEYIEYEIGPAGHCVGRGLLNTPEVAVQHAFLTAGSVFPRHIHKNAIEHLLVTVGELEVELTNTKEKFHLKRGDGVQLPKNQPHTCRVIADTYLIGVLIPSEPGYPEGQRTWL